MISLHDLEPEARIRDRSRRKMNWKKRYIKMRMAFARSVGIIHNHKQEKARRCRQIAKGMIQISEVI